MLDNTLNVALPVLFLIFLVLRFQLIRGTENSGKFYPIKISVRPLSTVLSGAFIETSHESYIAKLDVILINIVFSDDFIIVRSSDGVNNHEKTNLSDKTSILKEESYYPEIGQNIEGLVNVQCDNTFFQSVSKADCLKSMSQDTFQKHTAVDTTRCQGAKLIGLNPASAKVDSDISGIISTLGYAKRKSKAQMQLYLNMNMNMAGLNFSKCKLNFLKPSEQIRPSGETFSGRVCSISTSQCFNGSIPIDIGKMESNFYENVDGNELDLLALPTNKIAQITNLARKYIYRRQDVRNIIIANDNGADSFKDDSSNCVPLPDSYNEFGAYNFIEERLHAHVAMFPPEILISSLLKPILGPILDPVSSIVGGIISSVLSPLFENNMKQVIKGGLTFNVIGGLRASIVTGLIDRILGPLTEVASASIEENVMQSFRDKLFKQINGTLQTPIVEMLNSTLMVTIPAAIEKGVSSNLAKRLTKTLTHVLSRSLTMAIVPTLVHSISHSPLQDYYCYYCYKFKVYCQYCHLAPTQLYYATYYAGFYSTYYSNIVYDVSDG